MRSTLSSPTSIEAVRLVTCSEAQAYLSVSRSTLHRLERAGVLHGVRIGRCLRFRLADLQALATGGAK